MLRWKKNILFIEKNGLVFVVIAIILFYWTIDIITEGRLMSRLMITISLLVYGIFAQFLIDAQKAAKDSLRDSEEQHRLLIEKLPFAIFVDIQGKIVYVNPSFLTLFKVSSRDEVIGKRLENFSPLELFDSLKEGRRTLEVNIRRMDGAVITVFSTPMPITFDRQPATLVAISDITERKQMEEALRESEKKYRELSIIDNLTQLYNSRHFYHQLKIEIDRVDRYGEPLTLLLMDIDDFKTFNDAYGHVEGDQVLLRLGQVVKRCLRSTDSAYRYGGEEFTIILPMATVEEGVVTAERIRTEFRKEIFSPAAGKEVHVTVSIGLAQYMPQEDMNTFVHRVDQFMYQGKKDGKDRVCSKP